MSSSKPRKVIPWDKLTPAQRECFETTFMEDNARFARFSSTIERKDGVDAFVASHLWLHQESKRHIKEARDKSWSATTTEFRKYYCELEELWEKERDDAWNKIVALLKLWLMGGHWQHFEWLAAYGRQHAPNGIGNASADNTTTFPKDVATLRDPANHADLKLTEVILWEFIYLTGCQVTMLFADPHYPEGYDPSLQWRRPLLSGPPVKGKIPPRFLPLQLPTKLALKERVEGTWEGMNKSVASLQKDFSQALDKLGLRALPRAPRSSNMTRLR